MGEGGRRRESRGKEGGRRGKGKGERKGKGGVGKKKETMERQGETRKNEEGKERRGRKKREYDISNNSSAKPIPKNDANRPKRKKKTSIHCKLSIFTASKQCSC